MIEPPILSGNPPETHDAATRALFGRWAREADRSWTRSFQAPDAILARPIRVSDEPRPGPVSRLLCRYGRHRWVTMTTGRAGFVRFQRCERGCGTPRIVKGRP